MFVICSYHEPAPRGYNILCSRTQRDKSSNINQLSFGTCDFIEGVHAIDAALLNRAIGVC